MIQSVESEPTPLQQRMGAVGSNVLVTGSMVLVALVVVAGLVRTGDLNPGSTTAGSFPQYGGGGGTGRPARPSSNRYPGPGAPSAWCAATP